MGPTSGIVAGLLAVGAGVAIYQFARRQSDELRAAIEEFRGARKSGERVIDFEKDPATGVYRRRS